MIIEANGKSYSVKFFHNNKAKRSRVGRNGQPYGYVKGMPQGTLCEIKELVSDTESVVIAQGRANKLSTDNFDKSLGRGYALINTLKGLTNDLADAISSAYVTTRLQKGFKKAV